MVLRRPRTPGKTTAVDSSARRQEYRRRAAYLTALMQRTRRSGRTDKTQLRKRAHAIVQADFLNDLAIPKLQDSRTGEAHRPPRRRRQAAGQEVAESGTGMRAAAFPPANDVV